MTANYDLSLQHKAIESIKAGKPTTYRVTFGGGSIGTTTGEKLNAFESGFIGCQWRSGTFPSVDEDTTAIIQAAIDASRPTINLPNVPAPEPAREASPELVAFVSSGEVDPRHKVCGPIDYSTTGLQVCTAGGHGQWGEDGCAWAVRVAGAIEALVGGEAERLLRVAAEHAADTVARDLGPKYLDERLRADREEARAEAAEAERDALRAQVKRLQTPHRIVHQESGGGEGECERLGRHVCGPAGEVTPPAEQRAEDGA